MWGANLTEANVHLVDFSDVDLQQTRITADQLSHAGILTGALLPADQTLRSRLIRGLARGRKHG
jgi:hypothetical protein